MDIVLSTSAIREWTEADASDVTVTSRERAGMEQGGLVVKWVRGARDSQELEAASLVSPESIAAEVFRLLIQRHENIWLGEATPWSAK
jgi:hypothetical protein